MSGFGKMTIVGEAYNQRIVNVLHYRSENWLPLAGNPFDDVLEFLVACWGHIATEYLLLHDVNYTCLRVEGVGYDNNYDVVTSSPLIYTVNEPGTRGYPAGMGTAQSVNLGLRCGEPHLIKGSGETKRNRGYLSIGPVSEDDVDNYSHVSEGLAYALNAFGAKVDDNVSVLAIASTFVPIRVHSTSLLGIKSGMSYSDVMGYTVPRLASYRKSRRPEA